MSATTSIPAAVRHPARHLPEPSRRPAAGGEIDCLDPGGFGTVTITKSITLDCQATNGSILASATNGINVNAASTDLVILRNLSINGAGTTLGLHGINILSAGAVTIENVKVFNFSQQAIADLRSTGGALTIINTDVHTNLGAGLGTSTSGGTLRVLIDGLHSFDNSFGIALSTNTSAMIRNSDFSNNTTGIDNEGALIVATGNAISNNGTGVLSQGGTIRLSNNDIALNSVGINNLNGTVITYGNNRNTSSTSGTITPAGGATPDLGQQ
ncbi:hypothetical protein [Bradyrhizobium jicamae]|uniref:hypothetical protein n=1 Tax=Bradyrhizobium jicamae TaxID=280332 RepID=UPI001BA8B609|nr:hypothetical protein [Bradyrhizobium jicamae]MBR0937246.1 hypothetical protein [Bradyrhizobium jicamae]